MRTAALLAGLALTAAPAGAQDTAQAGRIWRGTLGDTAITACFFDEQSRAGIYYADSVLEPIRLEPTGAATEQTSRETGGGDDEKGATWRFAPDAEDRITGDWYSGDAMLPISLTAAAATFPEYGTPCESEAFLAPLLAGGETSAKRARLGRTRYTELAYAGPKRSGLDDYEVTTFALDPVRPGDAAINRTLAAAMPDGTAAHFGGQCAGWSMGSPGGGAGYLGQYLVPILIAPRWLGVRVSGSSYCGGAHPNHFSGLTVYDRDSGAEVDPASWFAPGALVFYDGEGEPSGPYPRAIAGLSEALAEAVLARWPAADDNPECASFARDGTGWQIGLEREGPVFVPQFAHVIFACTQEVVLPWAKARPFLSAEGRAVMDSLR